jgi:hypothetical protein
MLHSRNPKEGKEKIMTHVKKRLQERLHPAFGLSERQARQLIADALYLIRKHQLESDCIIQLAEADRKVTLPDGSNGDTLQLIVRGDQPQTVLLRRSSQPPLSGLPLYKLVRR